MSARARGVGLVLLSAVGYGMTPILLKFAYAEGAQMEQILYYRFLLAVLLLGGQLALRGRLRALPRDRWGTLALAAGVGGTLFAGITLNLFTAMKYLSASVSELLYFIYPIWVGLLSAALYKMRLRLAQWLCLAAMLAGLFLTLDLRGAAFGVKGLAFALLSSVCSAAYVLFAKRRVFEALDGYVFSLAVMLGALVCFAACYFGPGGMHPPLSGRAITVILIMTLASTLVAMCSYFLGIRTLSPTEIAALASVEPVVTLVGERLVLGTALGARVWLGAAVVIGAVTAFTLVGSADKTCVKRSRKE